MTRSFVLVLLLAACGPGTIAIVDDPNAGSDTDADPGDTDVEVLDADGDGFEVGDDCDDEDASVYPGAEELCDLVDHDCDGQPVGERVCPCERIYDLDGALYAGCEDFTSFDEAVEVCESNQMQLVVAASEGELDLVGTFGREARRPTVWVGATDRDDEGRFVWLDGTEVSDSVWARGEPNDWWDEDCAVWDTNRRGLVDIGCETPAAFMCESLRRL